MDERHRCAQRGKKGVKAMRCRCPLATVTHLSASASSPYATTRQSRRCIGCRGLMELSIQRARLSRSLQNRQAYCSRHGYGLAIGLVLSSLGVAQEWTSQRPALSEGRHPVWGQIAGPLELLNSGKYVAQQESALEPRLSQDWVFSMDCDSLFVDLSTTVDSLLYRFASRTTPWGKLELDPMVHFLISEDGRGLAGGNWIVRSSPQGGEKG